VTLLQTDLAEAMWQPLEEMNLTARANDQTDIFQFLLK
jgi:hypothetical protein